ncbi:MAG: hypothetical protein Q8T08_17735 [Ignavibacteria bacterium]|nr:hypothetical protein [Ignavibacteria bacterium]
MMKLNTFFSILLLIFVLALQSCKYDYVVPEPPIIIDPEEPISFAQEIAPMFSANNQQCTSCHKTGGTSPDLSAANAYASIVPTRVNLTDPETSIIYWHAHPASTTHVWKKLSQNEVDLMLVWIQQGAKNN